MHANTPVFHKRANEREGLWTLIALGGLLGDESSAARYSRGIERGDGRFASLVGRIGGLLGTGPFAARFSAQRLSRRPFVFLCEYHGFNVPDGHTTGLADLASRNGGPLGIVRTRELVIGARDAAAEADRWQRLLDPLRPAAAGHWQPGDGPALRIVEAGEDGIERMVWTVQTLENAAAWLRKHRLFGEEPEGAISIAPEALQGVNVWLTPER